LPIPARSSGIPVTRDITGNIRLPLFRYITVSSAPV